LVAINHYDPVQPEVGPLYYVDAMRSVTKQQVPERLCVIRIVEGQLNRFHGEPVILNLGSAIQQPVLPDVSKLSIMKALAGTSRADAR
jgi:hypothetical protein